MNWVTVLINPLSRSDSHFRQEESKSAGDVSYNFAQEHPVLFFLRYEPPLIQLLYLDDSAAFFSSCHNDLGRYILEPVERVYGAVCVHKMELQVGFEPTTASLQN